MSSLQYLMSHGRPPLAATPHPASYQTVGCGDVLTRYPGALCPPTQKGIPISLLKDSYVIHQHTLLGAVKARKGLRTTRNYS